MGLFFLDSKQDLFPHRQKELLSVAVYMRKGREDYLSDSSVDTIVPVAFLIFKPIHCFFSPVNPASYYLCVKVSPVFARPDFSELVLLHQKPF